MELLSNSLCYMSFQKDYHHLGKNMCMDMPEMPHNSCLCNKLCLKGYLHQSMNRNRNMTAMPHTPVLPNNSHLHRHLLHTVLATPFQ